MSPPTQDQIRRARIIIEYVRRHGPFGLPAQVKRTAEIAELAVALLLAERDRAMTSPKPDQTP